MTLILQSHCHAAHGQDRLEEGDAQQKSQGQPTGRDMPSGIRASI